MTTGERHDDPVERRRVLARERQRRCRERRRAGVRLVPLELELDHVDALVDADLLGAWDDQDADKIAEAVRRMFAEKI